MNDNGSKYDVISAEDLSQLILKVQAALNDGWVCQGGMAVASQYVYQVITKQPHQVITKQPTDDKWI